MGIEWIFDGGMGTMLPDFEKDESDIRLSCNEYRNLIRPDDVKAVHRAFLSAGSTVVETNTFGANPIVLSEYGLADLTAEINEAAVQIAKEAAADFPGARVAASIGPGSKLPSLGGISVDECADAYRCQLTALFRARPDFLLIETCQDLLQIKTVLSVIREREEEEGFRIPVMVSVTVEENGALLVGSSIEAVIAALEPYPLYSLGLNCATGPDKMEPALKTLQRESPFKISCMPNQGLPQIENGKAHYPLTPESFAQQMERLTERYGLSVVGGCCGTRPEHIAALTATLRQRGLLP